MDWLLEQILDWLTTVILATLDALIGVISSALLITPNVTALPQVQALTGRSILVVDSVFVLTFIAAGMLTMTAGGSEKSRYTIKDLIPRLIVGFVTAHFSQLWCGMLIDLANALTAVLTIDEGDSYGALRAIKTHVAAGQDKTRGCCSWSASRSSRSCLRRRRPATCGPPTRFSTSPPRWAWTVRRQPRHCAAAVTGPA
ncbi:hypothetical protein [Micromonospora costi]|uniref:hypothetical protein n=1 Tax=Micromonospora costi TaxID=1530042 RepID=UPI001F4DB49E|nr:hypothetical protein [Micromonospora costi]